MFGFGSKTKKLEKKYEQLLEEAFHLSKTSRSQSDEKTAEAEKIRVQLEELKKSV